MLIMIKIAELSTSFVTILLDDRNDNDTLQIISSEVPSATTMRFGVMIIGWFVREVK